MKMPKQISRPLVLALFVGAISMCPAYAAGPAPAISAAPSATYADLADLADSATLVARAQVRKLAQLEPVRARGVRPGWGRFYAEAKTGALLAGNTILGESLRYLVDLPLDGRGKPPRLKKVTVLLFAREVPGRPGEVQLVAPDAQVVWDAASEAKLRAILTELVAPGAPTGITGVREAIHVPGTLAGEGETQIFLNTRDGSAASLAIRRQGNGPTGWGVSFSELLDGGKPPARETLAWYRLACFLPSALPRGVNLSESPEDKAAAEADYRMVMGELAPCPRLRR